MLVRRACFSLIVSGAGGRYPSELCGRIVLYSCRHRSDSINWGAYARELNAQSATTDAPAEYSDLTVGEVESAYTSTRMFRNSMLRHKRRMMAKDNERQTAEKSKSKSID